MEQSQKFFDYLEANPRERKNRAALEKKFLDDDVLEYSNKSRLIRDKYVTEFQAKEVILRKDFNEKFPNLNSSDFRRLMKLGREEEKNNLKINTQKVEDKVILNSDEFKAMAKHFEKMQPILDLIEAEHMEELKKTGLNEAQIKDLSKRNREQSQKRMEYLIKDHEHHAEMRRDKTAFDKKFFDDDVLAYKSKMRELADKYGADPLYKKQHELHKQLRDKFPTMSPEDFKRLFESAKEDK